MWFLTDSGFVSVVRHRDEPEYLIVRSRVKSDLESLIGTTTKIWTMEDADYPHRALLHESALQTLIAGVVERLDYDNFKDAVMERQGMERHEVYSDIYWNLLALDDRVATRPQAGLVGRFMSKLRRETA